MDVGHYESPLRRDIRCGDIVSIGTGELVRLSNGVAGVPLATNHEVSGTQGGPPPP